MKRKLSFLLALLMVLQLCAYLLPGTAQAATVGSGSCRIPVNSFIAAGWSREQTASRTAPALVSKELFI